MSIFDLNRKITYEHININKNSAEKWYEQLGATSSTLYTYGTTENEVEYLDTVLNKKLYKTFDCIKLNGDVTLNFSTVFSDSDIENNYIFLKYYYVKYYYYDSEWDRPIYRWKYCSINEETIDSGYTTVLGNAFKLAADKSFLLPKGEYSLKGWEIIKISKQPIVDYFYADDTYKIGCSPDKNNKVKDNLNVNKVIDSKYITDARDYGNYAFYSIPSYGINNKNIRIFGDLNKSDEGNYHNQKGINYCYKNDKNEEFSFGTSVKSKYFREESDKWYPIVLFNDFGWSINNIPSSNNPLEITVDENRTSVVISFNGNTKVYKLQHDDEIILYARKCADYCMNTPELYYGINSNPNFFNGTIKNDNFIFKLNDIKMYKFYDFLDSNSFTLRDDIYLNNKNEYPSDRYKKIIKSLDDIDLLITNPLAFNGSGTYYDKYYRAAYPYCNFFFATFNYNNMIEESNDISFNCPVINNEVDLQSYEWYMHFDNFSYDGELKWNTTIPDKYLNKYRKITLINNKTILNDNKMNGSGNPYTKESFINKGTTISYTNIFTNSITTSVGLINKNIYKMRWYARDISDDFKNKPYLFHGTTDDYPHSYDGDNNEHTIGNITLDINHSLVVNNKYESYANVNQPAIAIILWTKHENH